MTAATFQSVASFPLTEKAQPSVSPYQVGIQFVKEYYTFMNKEPAKLHFFYKKQSQCTHAREGDREPKVCTGQLEIGDLFANMNLSDCRVLVSSVDCQASLNNSVVVVVIGEISNAGKAGRAFTQTFFLAEQPSGYYVHNDVFRYLNEEVKEVEEHSVVDTVKTTTVEEDTIISVDNGDSEITVETHTSTVVEEVTHVENIQAAVVEVKPKSWAKLAANEHDKWGKAAAPTKGTTVAAAPVQVQQKARKERAERPDRQRSDKVERPEREHTEKPERVERTEDLSLTVFVKNVSEEVTPTDLQENFSQFGTVANVEVFLPRSCAHVTFSNAEEAKAAVGSRPTIKGIELIVEERKARKGRPFTGEKRGNNRDTRRRGNGNRKVQSESA